MCTSKPDTAFVSPLMPDFSIWANNNSVCLVILAPNLGYSWISFFPHSDVCEQSANFMRFCVKIHVQTNQWPVTILTTTAWTRSSWFMLNGPSCPVSAPMLPSYAPRLGERESEYRSGWSLTAPWASSWVLGIVSVPHYRWLGSSSQDLAHD